MRRINRDRREHGVNAAVVESLGDVSRPCLCSCSTRRTRMPCLASCGTSSSFQHLYWSRTNTCMAAVNLFELFGGSVTVRTDVLRAVLDLLQETGDPDFHKFVQIVGGDGEKLYSLQQRIAVVAGFFQDALVEGHPLQMAVEIETRVLETHRETCWSLGGWRGCS